MHRLLSHSLNPAHTDLWESFRHDWDSAQWQPRLPLEIQFLILHAYIQSDPEPVEPIDPCAPDIAQICRDSGLPPPPAKKTPSFNRERLLLGGTSPLQAQNHRNLNYHRAATACLVNHGWYTEAVRSLYGTVTLRHPAHFDYMFGRHSVHGVMRQGRPGEHTQVLTLRNPPQNVCRFFDLRSTVPYIRFDLGSSRCFFTQVDEETKKPIEQLGRTTQRIGALATRSVPLYQLTMSLEARMLRLFVSEANPIDSTDDIWQDLIAGHIAALRMMVHVEHLIIDAELYLILLPSYFKTWCRTTEWQVVLEALKAEASEKPMATFFDDTHLETVSWSDPRQLSILQLYLNASVAPLQLTFVGSHVPTLAFLARISRAPRVKNINLVGWNQCGMKEEWVTFVKEDRLLVDAMCNWVAEDAAEV